MRTKTLGQRVASAPQFGFERLRALSATLERLRGVKTARPRGIFLFKTFQEAQDWWEQTRVPLLPDRQPRTT